MTDDRGNESYFGSPGGDERRLFFVSVGGFVIALLVLGIVMSLR